MAVFASTPDTFVVEEVAAYLPCGTGGHTYLWIEKRDLTTPEAVKRVARALGVNDRDAGYAGMKDRHATTRQWISVPGVDPAAASALQHEGVRVLEARLHGNKLRTGHLRGNRFEVVLTDVAAGERPALEAALTRLAAEGLPNRYGDQRFGASGDNAEVGRAILAGTRRERDHRRRRLMLSAVQAAVFNRVLEMRQTDGGLKRVRLGDVLQKTDSGGMFIADDVAVAQARVDAGEVIPTGPMLGSRTMAPPPGTAAADLEEAACRALGLDPALFANAGRDLPGARRPVVAPVELLDPPVVGDGDRLTLRFALPAGSYATVVLQTIAALVGAEAVLTFRPSA